MTPKLQFMHNLLGLSLPGGAGWVHVLPLLLDECNHPQTSDPKIGQDMVQKQSKQ